jgi:hypothetical protein
MSKYCNRWLDDAPGIRGDCEQHLKARKRCEDCPHRDVHREIKDLRKENKQLRTKADLWDSLP